MAFFGKIIGKIVEDVGDGIVSAAEATGAAVETAVDATGKAFAGAYDAKQDTADANKKDMETAWDAIADAAETGGVAVGNAFARAYEAKKDIADGNEKMYDLLVEHGEDLPLVGYGIAIGYAIAGDQDAAKKAAAKSTNATLVAAGAAAGAAVGGPAGAAAGAIIGSAIGTTVEAAVATDIDDENMKEEMAKFDIDTYATNMAVAGASSAAGTAAGNKVKKQGLDKIVGPIVSGGSGKVAKSLIADEEVMDAPKEEEEEEEEKEEKEMVMEIIGGDGWIELGDFRVGQCDSDHFSVSHKQTHKTCMIFRSDGEWFAGPHDHHGLADREYVKGLKNVKLGNGWMQFGDWRIGMHDEAHLSVSHKSRNTSMIWRNDGTRHPGPRKDIDGYWDRKGMCFVAKGCDANESVKHINQIQIGQKWRMGDVDGKHFSICSLDGNGKRMTAVVYTNEGGALDGKQNEFTLFPDPQPSQDTEILFTV